MKTGLSIAIPSGTYARVAPRSGLAWKHFIDTGAGVVDEDYRGEVGVVLFNHGPDDFAGKYLSLALLVGSFAGSYQVCSKVSVSGLYQGPASAVIQTLCTASQAFLFLVVLQLRGATGLRS